MKRGVVWTHLLFPEDELNRVVERHKGRGFEESDGDASAPPATTAVQSPPPSRSVSEDRLSALESQVQDLRGRLADLSDAYDALLARVERMSG
jgi:hypothetical protein